MSLLDDILLARGGPECGACHGPLYLVESPTGSCAPCKASFASDFAVVWNLGGVYNYRVRARIKWRKTAAA